jgi:hypothetical protein
VITLQQHRARRDRIHGRVEQLGDGSVRRPRLRRQAATSARLRNLRQHGSTAAQQRSSAAQAALPRPAVHCARCASAAGYGWSRSRRAQQRSPAADSTACAAPTCAAPTCVHNSSNSSNSSTAAIAAAQQYSSTSTGRPRVGADLRPGDPAGRRGQR